jgi:putative transport protein
METISGFFKHYPELAIFMTLGVGYWVGSIKLGNFSLGAVTGTLLVGVLVGQMHIDISSTVKSVFFLMFLFALGYGVGPQFFRGLKSDGLPQVWFAVIICVLCLVTTWICAKIAGFDAGTAAGLLSGAQTISAVMGVATDTINGLSLAPEQKKTMIDHIPVAYAVTYIFGTAGTAWILATLGPKILKIDLAQSCKEYEAKMTGGKEVSGLTGYRAVIARCYRISDALAGKTITDIEKLFGADRVFIERLRRGKELLEAEPSLVLKAGDIVGAVGRHEVIVELGQKTLGQEVEDREMLSVPAEVLEVILTHKDIAGKTIGELRSTSSEAAHAFARGVFIRKVERGGVELPLNAGLKLDRGDHVFLVGAKRDVERVADKIGYPDRVNDQTDMILVGLGVLVGGVIGAQAMKVGGVPISLSTSGGALILGLICGYLRAVNPKFGRISSGAQWFMSSVGLTTFIAVVGITSGPGFVAGLQALGVKLFIAGIVATSLPMIAGLYIGHYFFKFHPAINLGVNAGARVTTAALGQITDVAKSNVPALGYTVPYAISNTLLIVWGIVIVIIM